MRSKNGLHGYRLSHWPEYLRSFLVVCGLFICWMITALGQLVKYLSFYEIILVGVGSFLLIGVGLMIIEQGNRAAKDISTTWLFILWGAFVACGLALHPTEVSRRLLGMGSDREDALFQAIGALMHHHFPYYTRTFRGNPITPLPGAFLLALPFYLLGRISFENFFWAGMFLVVCRRVFRARSVAFLYFLAFLLLLPGNMQDIAAGGDYVTNVLYIACALFFLWRASKAERPIWLWPAATLFGFTLASRTIYFVALPIALALLLQNTTALRAWLAAVCSGGVGLLCVLPFYFYDPAHFTPLTAGSIALSVIPHVLHAGIVLPVAAAVIACSGFFMKLTLSRAYVILGFALTSMILPLFLLDRYLNPATYPLMNVVYFAPVSLFLSMGLLSYWEATLRQSYAGGPVSRILS